MRYLKNLMISYLLIGFIVYIGLSLFFFYHPEILHQKKINKVIKKLESKKVLNVGHRGGSRNVV